MVKRADNKRGDVNQVFVYAVSTIVVVFVAILGVNFVSTLGDDVNSRTISSFVNSIEEDLSAIQAEFNSESVEEYRIPGSISKLAFITPACNTEEYSDYSNDYYIIVYDSDNQVLEVREVIEYGVDGGCIEFERSEAEFIELAFVNQRNEILIQDLT
jgi:hypothetical protein